MATYELRERLNKFFDLGMYFLDNVSSIEECLLEAKETQTRLLEIIKLQMEIGEEFSTAERDYDIFLAEKRAIVHKILRNKGVTPTQQVVETTAIKMFKDEFIVIKTQYDDLKVLVDVANSLKMAMFQRKDVIVETIRHWRSKEEKESCILKNKEFISKIMKGVGND
jgi:dsDNA-binding SOS-regulon protein